MTLTEQFRQQGIEQGIERTTVEVVLNCYKNGVSIPLIACIPYSRVL